MPDVEQKFTTRRRRRKHQADESEKPDANLEGTKKFRIIVIIDKTLVSLVQRRRAYKVISRVFAFILSLQEKDPIKLN